MVSPGQNLAVGLLCVSFPLGEVQKPLHPANLHFCLAPLQPSHASPGPIRVPFPLPQSGCAPRALPLSLPPCPVPDPVGSRQQELELP